MSARGLRGLIFDKDGTLFDFRTTWEAWAASFLLLAADGDAELAARAGASVGFDLGARRFARDSIVIAGTQGEIVQALLPSFPAFEEAGLLHLINTEAARAPQAEVVPLPAFLDLLRARGLALGVATNDTEAPARAHLASVGVLGKFDFIAGYDSGHGGKPAPGQLLAFCARTGLQPYEVAMVGDSTHDLRAGRAAGMTTIAVLTGMAEAAMLEPFADVVLPDIGHIPDWLNSGA